MGPAANASAIAHLRPTRRALLRGAVAAAAAGFGRDAFAAQQQTHMPPGSSARARGPLVFLDYDQEELDAAYTQALWAPNQDAIARRTAQRNGAALARLGPPRRFAYGPTEIEQLDVFTTSAPRAPVNVFIHGGAWRGPSPATLELGEPSPAAWLAEMFVDRGAHFVALHFTNVLANGGNLAAMADQVRRGVAWVRANASRFGGDPQRVHVSGHSSGAHLAGVVLTTDWQKEFGLPADVVKGGLCASGMYDLHPVSLSVRSSYVTITPQVIDALSAQRHLDRLKAPIIVGHGTLETPEFQRQTREFAAAVNATGKSVEYIVLEGRNHFEVGESLGSPYDLLTRAMLRQMGLALTEPARADLGRPRE